MPLRLKHCFKFLLSHDSVRLIILLDYCRDTESAFHKHDKNFQHDYVLIATAQNISYDCQLRYSVVLNGSSPGPPLYLTEGYTTWTRVYNNITDQNLTVVSWKSSKLI